MSVRPAPAARDSVVAVGLVALAASGLSLVVGLGSAYAMKATAAAILAAMLGVGLGCALSAGRPPVARLGAADRITLARAALVMLVLACLGERPDVAVTAMATLLAATAALLDAVDGWVARRAGQSTAFGARFDMETDAFLILVLSLLAWQWDRAGAWILLAGLARYLFLAATAVAPWGNVELPPSRRRQAACVIQVVALIVCIAPWVPAPASAVVAAAGLAALVFSFTVDLFWLQCRAGSFTRQEGYRS